MEATKPGTGSGVLMRAFAGYDEETGRLCFIGGVCKAREIKDNIEVLREVFE